MNRKLLVLIFLVSIIVALASGCTGKKEDIEINEPELVKDIPTPYGTFIHVDTAGGVVPGYTTDSPARILDVPDGTWMFIQDNSSGGFEIKGRFQDLDRVPSVKLSFPNGKIATLDQFWWEYVRTDERGVEYYYLRVDQEGFKNLHSWIMNENDYRNGGYEEKFQDTDPLEDEYNPMERYKTTLTKEETISGDRWLIRISGEYY